MEARGFLAGAWVRFTTNATHKKPAAGVGEPTTGQFTYLIHDSPTAKPKRRSRAFAHTTAIAIPGCIFNVNEKAVERLENATDSAFFRRNT
ncbi:hypothetical protein ABIB68_000028 [Bradyrhizobium sp. F1.2.2]